MTMHHGQPEQREEDALRERYPFVALTIQSTRIHPSTGRLITIDAQTFDAEGQLGPDFHVVLNPGGDPGPRHLHGLRAEDVASGKAFSQVLKSLDRLIDGRTLIVHDTPYTWGFIVAEARRAMMAAARQNRARNRSRGKGRRRRQKVGHVPTPVAIVDTLASARLQGLWSNDIRLNAVARRAGVAAEDPTASLQRALRPEAETSRAETTTLIALYRALAGGALDSYEPDDLRADRCGLQRSAVRVDAAEAARQHHNPGTLPPGGRLRRGMEVVIAPEIDRNPDELIEALTREGLNYAEKLTRETSVVVCDATVDLVGKPMHAQRKGIPLLPAADFLAALGDVAEPLEAPADSPAPQRRARVPHSGGRRSGGRRRSGRRGSGSCSGAGSGSGAGAGAGSNSAHTSPQKSAQAPAESAGSPGTTSKGGGQSRNRRRRRRGRNSGHNRGRNNDT